MMAMLKSRGYSLDEQPNITNADPADTKSGFHLERRVRFGDDVALIADDASRPSDSIPFDAINVARD